ncbi:MAG TPA: histidinol-phosphate transaminase [Bacilli bacterium]|nr:histidinol-phosphate transaminase [Bacilli bacterium]
MTTQLTVRSFNASIAGADDLHRLHLSENHYGMSPAVREAIEEELQRIHLYPDPDCSTLREQLAAHYGVTADMVIVGNGTDEILLLTSMALLGPGKTSLTTDSTFPGYKVTTALSGGETRFVPMTEDYRMPAAQLANACRAGIDVVFLCNPHNPTGTMLSAAELCEVLTAASEAGVVPVLDEAYADFADQPFPSAIPYVREGLRGLVMRTFSKSHGLAGFRVGYAIGSPDLIAAVQRMRSALPFSVNRLAQTAALTALRHPDFVTEVRKRTQAVKRECYRRLEQLGLSYVPSQTNFVLVRVPGDSAEVSRRLVEEHQVLTRDTTAFGYPGHLRVSMGTQEQMAHFCDVLAQVLKGGTEG